MGSVNSGWVLIIEDVRDQADLGADVCVEAGLNAMAAASGVQGYRRACELQPAVIVLDIMLPDIDGWETCRRLKTDPRTRPIPIVMLTARDEPANLRRAAQAGCAAYLKKPCPPPDLVATIKRVLREHESN